MKRITGGQAVVKTLEACAVKTIFGIPGLHNLAVYEALLDSSIRHITARHEQGSGFMAYGYARSSGEVGAALVISGPGLTNILTPLGEAFHESVPILLISSNIPTRFQSIRSGMLHELADSTLMVRSVCKESRTVTVAEKIPLYIAEAYSLAKIGRPGPVHVEIPLDLLQQQIVALTHGELENIVISMENPAPLVSADRLNMAADTLMASGHPVIIAGSGACRANHELAELAERLGAPVLLTTGGKGVMDERHPLCVGACHHFPAVQDFVVLNITQIYLPTA